MIKPPPETEKCCRYDCKHIDKDRSEYPCYFCTCNRNGNKYFKSFQYEGKEREKNDTN